MRFISAGGSKYVAPQFQWAPTLGAHDPNPPIIIGADVTTTPMPLDGLAHGATEDYGHLIDAVLRVYGLAEGSTDDVGYLINANIPLAGLAEGSTAGSAPYFEGAILLLGAAETTAETRGHLTIPELIFGGLAHGSTESLGALIDGGSLPMPLYGAIHAGSWAVGRLKLRRPLFRPILIVHPAHMTATLAQLPPRVKFSTFDGVRISMNVISRCRTYRPTPEDPHG